MTFSSQEFESYIPVYDTIPEKWEESRPFFVEILKKISNAVNIREIGWLLDEEYLSGQAFIPGTVNPLQFRSVLRKVIVFPTGLAVGINNQPHGITVDANFTLIQMYGTGTSSIVPFASQPFGGGNDMFMDVNQVYINSPAIYNRAYAFISYIQEL